MKRSSEVFDDESDLIEPPEKSTRIVEGPYSSDEVVELRQKVAKLEKDYQGACLIADEYETQLQEYRERVESLEDLLDAKPIMTSSEETNELMRKLDSTRTSLEDSKQVNREFIQQVNRLTRKNEELRRVNQSRMAECEKLSITRNKLEGAIEDNKELQRCNNELLQRLAKYEQATQVEAMKPMRFPVISAPNILKLCPPIAPGTISCVNAVRMLRSVYFPSDLEWMEKFTQEVKDNILVCNLCAEPHVRRLILKGTEILEHFFTLNHSKKVHDQHGTVSFSAYEYWMHKLNKIPKPKPPNGRVMILHKNISR